MTGCLRVSTVVGCVVLGTATVNAQVLRGPGVPHDGVLDAYYNSLTETVTVTTSLGDMQLFPGILAVDTDGNDLVAISIGGPDVSTFGCNLCDNHILPGALPSLADFSLWMVDYSAGSTQWYRETPTTGDGFRGVIAFRWLDGTGTDYSWIAPLPPTLIAPIEGSGIANYGPGLERTDFAEVLDDGNGGRWSVQWASDTAGTGFTNVTVISIPEATSLSLFGMSVALVGWHRRRIKPYGAED